jgi:Protein of unknown function (DUF1592)/Protein of unknown function (DUF1588)/Protein of unknown function (DUF1595)/Protein of unknown function (DUF1585)/Protein of unknown function (DUF1587)
MKLVVTTVAVVTTALAVSVGTATGSHAPRWVPRPIDRPAPSNRPPVRAKVPSAAAAHPAYRERGARGISTAALNGVIEQYCGDCHNENLMTGNLSLDGFDVANADKKRATSEKMIRKLRAEMMPLPGAPRPAGDTLKALVETMEDVIDRSSRPNPGARTFQRLNRTEYERVIKDLLGLEVNAGDFLPLDTKSANFDNIADVQMLSPTLLEAYLNAGAAVSRLAVGDRNAPPALVTHGASPFTSQHPWDHVEGAPYGTRGGIVTNHDFPADGYYAFRLNISGGTGTRLEDLDVSVAGERVALLHYEKGVDQNLASADSPAGADYISSEPILIKAGQKKISASFVRRGDGPYEDLIKPHDWSKASNGTASAGTTEPPHVMEIAVVGPRKVTGISETPSRKIVFSCHPAEAAAQKACAEKILTRLGTKAYRRPLTQHDREGLMSFYTSGAAAGGFEEGVRTALQAMLSSPHFVFRFEKAPANVAPGQDYQISDYDLASRLSFFLWESIPDEELMSLAQQHKLSNDKVLEAQVKRMLADPRSEVLSTRFAAQWLRLQDIEKVRPDAFWFPDYTQQLAESMARETELFFNDIVKNNRSILDLFTADYTFVNERLARHYGIPNVSGPEFRKVTYPDSTRRGLLGQGSMLVQTSLANRTSPVLRGKWVMEVLIGMPPPPPPPNVPTLDETTDGKDGRPLTTRERMELHRKNPTCNTCHQYMDPIGLSLDNFDVTGKWRYRENGMLLDTKGKMYDGTPVSTPGDLLSSLLKRPIPLVRSFTENLMAYALGRRVEDYDQPTVRAIAKQAEANNYRISSVVLAVVKSSAFRSKRADPVASTQDK